MSWVGGLAGDGSLLEFHNQPIVGSLEAVDGCRWLARNSRFSVFKTSENVLAFFVVEHHIHFCTVAPISDNVPY